MKSRTLLKVTAVGALALLPALGWAAEAKGLIGIINNIKGIFGPLEQLIVAMCYVFGVALAGAGILKFKQHKDNPTQVPLGGPIALIFISAALIWLPQIITDTGETAGLSGDGSAGAGTATGKNIISGKDNNS